MKSTSRQQIRIFVLNGNRNIIDAPEKIITTISNFVLKLRLMSLYPSRPKLEFFVFMALFKLALFYEIRNTFTKNQFKFFDGTY